MLKSEGKVCSMIRSRGRRRRSKHRPVLRTPHPSFVHQSNKSSAIIIRQIMTRLVDTFRTWIGRKFWPLSHLIWIQHSINFMMLSTSQLKHMYSFLDRLLIHIRNGTTMNSYFIIKNALTVNGNVPMLYLIILNLKEYAQCA